MISPTALLNSLAVLCAILIGLLHTYQIGKLHKRIKRLEARIAAGTDPEKVKKP